jgi:hypothetical protein
MSSRTRFILGGAGGALIVVGIVALATSTHHRHRLPPPAKLPALREVYANPPMGASGALAAGWTAVKGTGILRLSDPSRKAIILIAAVAQAPRAQLLKDALASLRGTYRQLSIKQGNGTKLGGRPASSLVVYARNQRRVQIRILLAVASGLKHAYVVEAVTARSAPLRTLVETQEALTALQLRG